MILPAALTKFVIHQLSNINNGFGEGLIDIIVHNTYLVFYFISPGDMTGKADLNKIAQNQSKHYKALWIL